MDKTEALLKHMRELAAWLEIQARDFDNGRARHLNGGVDDSADAAADFRHKLGNIAAVVQAYHRLKAREGD
jgi:hypothetical protein